jgi:hypothetical protein
VQDPGEGVLGVGGPDERFGAGIVRIEIVIERVDPLQHASEYATK